MKSYFRYWGKAKKPLEVDYCSNILGDDEVAGNHRITTQELKEKVRKNKWTKVTKGSAYASYHLLAYHSLDVAAVGWVLLAPEQPQCRRLADQLDLNPEWLRNFFVFCLALHDLGKFSNSFQGLRQDLSPNLVKAKTNMPYSERHDSLGFCLWRDVLQKVLPDIDLGIGAIDKCLKQFDSWMEIVTGHHGMPPKNKLKGRLQNFFEQEDEQAALEFLEDACKLFLNGFDIRPLLEKSLKKRLRSISWQLAGVAVLADWLGSNQDCFQYCSQPQALEVD